MAAMDSDAHQDPTSPTSERDSWEERSRRIQERYYHDCKEILEKRYRYNFPSICQLLLKGWCDCFELGHGRCRNDTELNVLGFVPVGESTADHVIILNKKQLSVVEKIFENIICAHHDTYERGDDIVVSFTLFLIEIDSGVKRVIISPVFQVINPQNGKGGKSNQVIDSDGRVYKSWQLFLNENLQSGKCCYPKNGRYILDDEGALNLCYGETAAYSGTKKALRVADVGVSFGGGTKCVSCLPSKRMDLPKKCELMANGIRYISKVFKGAQLKTMKGETTEIAGKAKVIRSTNHVSDADKFCSSVINSRKAGMKTKFNDTGASAIKFGNETCNISGATKQDYSAVPTAVGASTLTGLNMLSKNRISAIIDKIADALSSYLHHCLQVHDGKLSDIETVIAPLRDICSRIPFRLVFDIIKLVINAIFPSKALKTGANIVSSTFNLLQKLDSELNKIQSSTEEETGIRTFIAYLRDICLQDPIQLVLVVIKVAIQIAEFIIGPCKALKTGHQIVSGTSSLIKKHKPTLEKILRKEETVDNNDGGNSDNILKKEETVDNNDGGKSDNITEDCVEDLCKACRPLLPNLLQEGLIGAEELYYLPSHLPSVFTLEDYLSIGQNALGISNVKHANITQNQLCTNVYFEGYGVVFVTVKACERMVVVQKVTPNDTKIDLFAKCYHL